MIPEFKFDYTTSAGVSSAYNCALGGGYLNSRNIPGAIPNHSIIANATEVFTVPGVAPGVGNGFYGYGFHAKQPYPFSLHTDRFIYQAQVGESGTITFSNVYVFELVAGYQYIDSISYGALVEMASPGVSFNPANPTRTLNAVFSYGSQDGLTFISGDVEAQQIFELVQGVIQFKANYISFDWVNNPQVPHGGGYTADAVYTNLVSGFIAGPALLCVGAKYSASFSFTISNQVYNTTRDFSLPYTSPCVGTGLALTIPELLFDIAGQPRTGAVWDIGPFAYSGLTTQSYYSFERFVSEIKTGNPVMVFLVDIYSPITIVLNSKQMEVTSGNRIFDLGYLFYSDEVLTSEFLLSMVATHKLLAYRGVIRLDSTSVLKNAATSTSTVQPPSIPASHSNIPGGVIPPWVNSSDYLGMATTDFYGYQRFISEVQTGNAVRVALTDRQLPQTIRIGAVDIQLGYDNPVFDLGSVFFPPDILKSQALKSMVLNKQLLTYVGVVRLDNSPK